jgi:hypothetical protein
VSACGLQRETGVQHIDEHRPGGESIDVDTLTLTEVEVRGGSPLKVSNHPASTPPSALPLPSSVLSEPINKDREFNARVFRAASLHLKQQPASAGACVTEQADDADAEHRECTSNPTVAAPVSVSKKQGF